MDRNLKLWEFLAGLIAMSLAFGTVIYNSGTTNGKNEVRITNLENKVQDIISEQKEHNEKVTQKMDDINNSLFDIKILLQQKQDRKK
jgi:hypothetical protein